MDQSVVAPYPEVSVFVTRNGIDDRIVEATEQRRQAVVPCVQLVDVVAEQQHVVGAVLIQVDRFSPIAEAGGRFVVNDCERLFLSGRRIEDEYSL